MKKSTIIVLLVVLISSIFALRALAIPNFYTSHDGLTHTARIANFYLALKEGQLPPRLAPKLFGSLGFPMFIFIYPLPYFLSALIYQIGYSFTASFEIVIGLSFILSAISMYIFAKEFFGKFPGLIAALFYTWAPYRFSQLYVRAAIAESFAYIFIPLVLLALFRISKRANNRWLGIGSLSLAGLLLSHQLVSLMFLPVFVLFAGIFLLQAKDKKKFASRSLLMALLGFLTSAFIYMPSLFERKFLHFDELINYYSDHFVTIRQLIHSPWNYGFSMPGSENDDMSFQIGLTQLLAAGLAFISILVILFKEKKKGLQKPKNIIAIVSLIIFSVSVSLMLDHPIIHWLWEKIPPISVIDFPWRLLGVSVFSASLLASYLVATSRYKLILYPVLLFFVFYANRNHLRINQTVVFPDEFFLQYQETATWRNEFLPKWRITNKIENLEKDFHISEGKISVLKQEINTHRLKLDLLVEEAGSIDINRLYFPGWRITLDGNEIPLGNGFSLTKDIKIETQDSPFIDRSGFIRVKVPEGEHTLVASFQETAVRKVGFLSSFIGLTFSLVLLVSNTDKSKKKSN